jgi:hypothetical protein
VGLMDMGMNWEGLKGKFIGILEKDVRLKGFN